MPGVFERYLLRRILLYCAVILLLIVVLLQMLDLMAHSQKIMAAPGASVFSLGRYALLHAPVFIGRFMPFAVLLAVILTLAQMGGSSEIIALRAAGLSPLAILSPLLVGGMVLGAAHFMFQETLAATAARALKPWEANKYAARDLARSSFGHDIWRSAPGMIVHTDTAMQKDGRMRLSGFRVYQIDAHGLVEGLLQAKTALPEKPSWMLEGVKRTALGQPGWRRDDLVGWTTPLTAADFVAASAPQSLIEWWRKAREERQRHELSGRTILAIYTRFARPLSDFLMPLLGLFVGFSLPRAGRTAQQLLAGAGIGFFYFALESLLVALGNGGLMAPFLAAFGALILFAGFGLYTLTGLETQKRKARSTPRRALLA